MNDPLSRLVPIALLALLGMLDVPAAGASADSTRPNILVVVADDLGYADVGFHGCKDIPTPHLDALAARGVRCTNGYVSHPFCSPTRAALLTGRYQQRFGHEFNPKWDPADAVAGLPVDQVTLPQVLRAAGYATGWVGKWHLGAHPQFHPLKRGFDETYGILGGGHDYLPRPNRGAKAEYGAPMDRNGKPEPQDRHLTEVFGTEAASFVRRRGGGKPWFLYLAFNAPHGPLQPAEEDLAPVAHIGDEQRRKGAGLVVGLDRAVGRVLEALRESGQEKNTLVWFFSDNGGPTEATGARNEPLRGQKGQVYEGGIRVPFVLSWPGRLPEGKTFEQPVITLDVFATAAALAGAKVPETHRVEGVDLMPFLAGTRAGAPHERLCWRAGGTNWAVRQGDWKLVSNQAGAVELYHLKEDVAETRDVASEHPDRVERLKAAWDEWNRSNVAPLFEGAGARRAARPRP
jgi:arylsulfatase A-like enzyme